MKIHKLITDNFTPEQIQLMLDQSTYQYTDESEDVDYFLFLFDNDVYVELRTDNDSLDINDVSIKDTDGPEEDTEVSKEDLIAMLESGSTKSVTQIEVD